MEPWSRMVLTAAADFFLAAGGAVSAAMLETGSTALPGKGVWILAVITGGIAFWSHLKASLAEPPPK